MSRKKGRKDVEAGRAQVSGKQAQCLGGVAKTVQEENPVRAPLLHVDRLRTVWCIIFDCFFRDHSLR